MRSFVACLLAVFVALSSSWASSPNDDLLKGADAGHLEAVQRSLQHGARANAADNMGRTALMIAARAGHLDIVKLLVKNGAQVNTQDSDGETALMKAIRGGHKAVDTYLLLEAGANCKLKNKDGLTAMDIAVGVTPEIEKATRADAARQKPATLKTSFLLTETAIACDSLKTHKELWVAASQSKDGASPSFSAVLASVMVNRKAMHLSAGTQVTLTGKATGIVSQVTVPNIAGTWWIPNTALKAANIPLPPNEYSRWADEEDASR